MYDNPASRFMETGEGLKFYREEDMQCRDCRYATGQPSSCERYRTKPAAVLAGQQVCPRFTPRDP